MFEGGIKRVMSKYARILVDSGIIVALYDSVDDYHHAVIDFLYSYSGQLVTTVGCITESMWLLASDWKVQNELLLHLSQGIYTIESLVPEDFLRIADLNAQYADLPGDFADLALVAISERLKIAEIAILDKDFDIYRRYRNQSFNRVFYP